MPALLHVAHSVDCSANTDFYFCSFAVIVCARNHLRIVFVM